MARSGEPSWGDHCSRLPTLFLSGSPRLPMDAKEVGSLGKEQL